VFEFPADSTPLDPDTIAGLIPDLKTQAELNEYEQMNIEMAVLWARRSSALKMELLSISSLQKLHNSMFDVTWKWAGKFRNSDTNLGIPWSQIPIQVRQLCDNTAYQIKHKIHAWDELGARFHHRLVYIHPFPNGNGRHARLATELLLRFNGQPEFTWGSLSSLDTIVLRSIYIAALKQADNGNIQPLLDFCRQ
jgi:Fic-DOC domain mobile mystery protein B